MEKALIVVGVCLVLYFAIRLALTTFRPTPKISRRVGLVEKAVAVKVFHRRANGPTHDAED